MCPISHLRVSSKLCSLSFIPASNQQRSNHDRRKRFQTTRTSVPSCLMICCNLSSVFLHSFSLAFSFSLTNHSHHSPARPKIITSNAALSPTTTTITTTGMTGVLFLRCRGGKLSLWPRSSHETPSCSVRDVICYLYWSSWREETACCEMSGRDLVYER